MNARKHINPTSIVMKDLNTFHRLTRLATAALPLGSAAPSLAQQSLQWPRVAHPRHECDLSRSFVDPTVAT